MRHFKIISAVFVLVGACATASQTGDERSSGQTLTRDEILASGAATADEAIRQLRPGWPRPTGGGGAIGSIVVEKTAGRNQITCTGNGPIIYEGTRQSTLDLRQFSADRILEIRFIRPYERRPDGSGACENIPALQVILINRILPATRLRSPPTPPA